MNFKLSAYVYANICKTLKESLHSKKSFSLFIQFDTLYFLASYIIVPKIIYLFNYSNSLTAIDLVATSKRDDSDSRSIVFEY